MKFIHTADWHLGQSLYQNDRAHEHLAFLGWLKEKIKEHGADALLIAGDIFDNPNPSAASQRMLYQFLKELNGQNPDLQMVIIAGNHDSAYRIEAPVPLLEDMKVYVKGTVKRNEDGAINYNDLVVRLYGADDSPVWCMAVPYLRQGDLPSVDEKPESNIYNEGVKTLYSNLLNHIAEQNTHNDPVIAMGHLQASGVALNSGDESERKLIGGIEGVKGYEIFPGGITYTALGHIHRAQKVAQRENIRYSGSPLPMSFAEENYRHGVNLVEIKKGEPVKIEKLEFEPVVRLVSVPQRLQQIDGDASDNLKDVLKMLKSLPKGEPDMYAPYLQVRVSFRQMIPDLRQKVEKALEGYYVRLTKIVTDNVNEFKPEDFESVSYDNLSKIEPLEMARRAFQIKNLQMGEELERLFNEVVKEINNEN